MKQFSTTLAVIAALAVSSAASAGRFPKIPQPPPIDLCAPPWVDLGLCPR